MSIMGLSLYLSQRDEYLRTSCLSLSLVDYVTKQIINKYLLKWKDPFTHLVPKAFIQWLVSLLRYLIHSSNFFQFLYFVLCLFPPNQFLSPSPTGCTLRALTSFFIYFLSFWLCPTACGIPYSLTWDGTVAPYIGRNLLSLNLAKSQEHYLKVQPCIYQPGDNRTCFNKWRKCFSMNAWFLMVV